ncbi:YciI family protein [Pseudomethylobacillus aquaticus]|uniref:YciI family protein n=1 Tax=Pseudomethylobacillus aquaticus TaxID=2676064 RepID=A0A3N0V731_9PROT|nr:YciI family protein [Pseudomethylobacillus aquaticus]ROH88422.1 YciI family protein [Pseudomethylobacillus aquaticus]
MWYAIIAEDHPNSLEQRMAARPQHLQRLQALMDESRLLLAGPFPAVDATDPGAAGFSGSLIVAEFADLRHAQEWANTDPFVAAGVYAKVTVKPFRKTLPAIPALPDNQFD